jgi:hypothetical protein
LKIWFLYSSRLDSLGMRVTSVRLFFIYISFVTAGLWFGVYLTLAWIRLKDLIRANEPRYSTYNFFEILKGPKVIITLGPF